jgi:hypothetical protein
MLIICESLKSFFYYPEKQTGKQFGFLTLAYSDAIPRRDGIAPPFLLCPKQTVKKGSRSRRKILRLYETRPTWTR